MKIRLINIAPLKLYFYTSELEWKRPGTSPIKHKTADQPWADGDKLLACSVIGPTVFHVDMWSHCEAEVALRC